MKKVHVTNRSQWREWLAEHHAEEPRGIWLIFQRKATGRTSLEYEEAVEEALCFGWIDSTIRRIDERKYCRKFSPRKETSRWSASNKERVRRLLKEGKMTEFGQRTIDAAKRSGRWEAPRPIISMDMPQDLSQALARDKRASAFFERLAPSYRKHFLGWIGTAKTAETRAKRLKESPALMARGEKLGMK